MKRLDLFALGQAIENFGRELRALAGANAIDGAELLPIVAAARIAATSPRVVKEAIRAGDLAAFGKQRDRAVRRSDLDAWIESRRAKSLAGPDCDDIDRRVDELERARAKRAKKAASPR